MEISLNIDSIIVSNVTKPIIFAVNYKFDYEIF